MGRNAGRHTYRDSLRTVDEQIRNLHRQHARLLLRGVKVGQKIHHVLVQIGQKRLLCDLLQPGFRVTHGRGAVPFDIAEVAVPVDQGQSLLEVLGHDHQRLIDRTVSVRMIFTHGIAHDTRRLTVGPVIADAKLIHIVQRPSLHRF